MVYVSTGRFMRYLEDVISGKRRGLLSTVLRLKLLLISWICLGAVKLRRWLYSKGIPRVKHLPCKVISVGNVVVGGSGKTPAVIAITGMLKEHADLSVAVFSRGYRSKVRGPAVVSDGESILLSHVEAGDEPYLLGRSLPGVPILIGKDRFQTGLMAVRRWDCRVVILDDGFQYLRLSRDIDIVTIDATRPFGFNHILPRGYLREPLSVLERADLILLTRVDQCEHLNSVRDRLTEIAPSVPIFDSIYQPLSLSLLGDSRRQPSSGGVRGASAPRNQEVELDYVKGRSVLAVSGIANPMSFVETLRSLCPAKVDLLSFPDHHAYPPRSIEMIERKAAELNVDFIVTTEKDAPKLRAIVDRSVLSLTVGLKLIGPAAGRFAEFIRQRCGLDNDK